ncbi:hypothetical protein [Bosea sp. (in: a-proteobacteria)]|uniref:hypothetical protein n=1 Tax=Bosea sp. (in: a-proteobacteria) TaxID=1871050 RepID=UPI003B3B249B
MSGSYANFDECEAADLDPKAVDRLAKRLGRAARDAKRLGLTIFGGSGHGSLRIHDQGDRNGALIVGVIEGTNWDGGDGGNYPHADGLWRGER